MSGERQARKTIGGSDNDRLAGGIAGRRSWAAFALIPATILCLVNAAKPLVVDDTAYHAYAVQISKQPADPYGFTIDWYERPKPAFEVLAPPVLPYWWAAAIRLFGDEPGFAKIWLWPFCAALAISVRWLAGRYCPSVANSITWFVVLSPSILPSLNLMLDVPALALSLSALALFLGTQHRSRGVGAFAAGVLAGLATQTKYTALLTPVEIILAAWFSGDRRAQLARAACSVAVAAAVFVGWEWYVAAKYGQSHFLFHLPGEPGTRFSRSLLFWPLIGLLGSVAGPLGILALASRGARMLPVVLASAMLAAGFLVVGAAPWDWPLPLSPNAAVFGPVGLAVAVLIIAAAMGRIRAPNRTPDDRFLVAWLVAEVAGYFVLTPWPAVRRVIGMLVAAAFVVGRAAEFRPAQRGAIIVATFLNIGLAVALETIDTENARIEQSAVVAIDSRIQAEGGGRVWFLGRRGWQFHAEQTGWRPVQIDVTTVSPGDWLVVPDAAFGGPRVRIPETAKAVDNIEFHSRWPISTIPWYYGTNAAVRRESGPFLTVALYRATVEERLVPQSK